MSISSFNILGWGIFCLFISLEYIYLSFPQQVDLFKNICLVKNTLLSQNSLNKKKNWCQFCDYILICKNQWFTLTVAQYFSDLSSKAGVKLNQGFTSTTWVMRIWHNFNFTWFFLSLLKKISKVGKGGKNFQDWICS